MRRITACVSTLALLATGAGCGKVRARQEMHRGIAEYKAHQYEKAKDAFVHVTAEYPEWGSAWINLGYSCMQAVAPGSTSEKDKEFAQCAIDAFKKYTEITPAGAERDSGTEYLITAYNNAHKQDDGIVYFKPLHEANPNDIKLVKVLRALYQSKGDLAATVEWVDKEINLTVGDDKETREQRAALRFNLCGLYMNKILPIPSNVGLALLTSDEKFSLMEKGIGYCEQAMKDKENYVEAFVDYNILHRQRAKLTNDILASGTVPDPARQAEMKKQADEDLRIADEYMKKAQEIMKQRRAEEARRAGIALPAAPGAAPASVPAAPSAPASAAPAPAPAGK